MVGEILAILLTHHFTIPEAQNRIDVLQFQAERTSQQLEQVRVDLKHDRSALQLLRAKVDRESRRVTILRKTVIDWAVHDYQTSLGPVSDFLSHHDPKQLVEQIIDRKITQNREADVVTALQIEKRKLERDQHAAHVKVVRVAKNQVALVHKKEDLARRTSHIQGILSNLERKKRERLAALQAAQAQEVVPQTTTEVVAKTSVPVAPSPPPPAPSSTGTVASSGAQTAVAFAMAQIGDAYVYGATGPDAWDCSGLTQAAWAAAGVTINRTALDQSYNGTPISTSQLVPGDLVFYYSPISHVAMYIGNGQIVQAANPSVPVEVSPLYSMPVAAAVHIG